MFYLCLMVGPIETPGEGGKDDQINFDDALYIHPSDNVVTTLITIRLTRSESFRLWRSSMSRALRATKLGFVDGTLKRLTLMNLNGTVLMLLYVLGFFHLFLTPSIRVKLILK